MNARTALLGIFVALTIAFASTTIYESGIRASLTPTDTSTVTHTIVSTSMLTSVSVSTITTVSLVDHTTALKDAYLSHIGAIETENATVLAAQYETNATLQATVIEMPPSGFDGIANITKFYEGNDCPKCFSDMKLPLSVANETYSLTMSGDLSTGNVTSRLIFYGTPNYRVSYLGGPPPSGTVVTDSVGFKISYVLQGDSWLISTESLTYYTGGLCQVLSLSPDGVLTCPPL
ncbi:MAG: hypothetical protein JRN58_03200 [Nitrososphaerota archaeon]|nr:hypothetical protein [Nitrososphaerota archaeon]MDG6978066.1 hypothetical protein [Nitrososphaerota archaeon]